MVSPVVQRLLFWWVSILGGAAGEGSVGGGEKETEVDEKKYSTCVLSADAPDISKINFEVDARENVFTRRCFIALLLMLSIVVFLFIYGKWSEPKKKNERKKNKIVRAAVKIQ